MLGGQTSQNKLWKKKYLLQENAANNTERGETGEKGQGVRCSDYGISQRVSINKKNEKIRVLK